MIVLSYDLMSNDCKLDTSTILEVHKNVQKLVGNDELVISVPSGITIAEMNNKNGLEYLKSLQKLINNLINEIEEQE